MIRALLLLPFVVACHYECEEIPDPSTLEFNEVHGDCGKWITEDFSLDECDETWRYDTPDQCFHERAYVCPFGDGTISWVFNMWEDKSINGSATATVHHNLIECRSIYSVGGKNE